MRRRSTRTRFGPDQRVFFFIIFYYLYSTKERYVIIYVYLPIPTCIIIIYTLKQLCCAARL